MVVDTKLHIITDAKGYSHKGNGAKHNINIDDSFTHSQQPGRNILEKTHDNAVIDSLT